MFVTGWCYLLVEHNTRVGFVYLYILFIKWSNYSCFKVRLGHVMSGCVWMRLVPVIIIKYYLLWSTSNTKAGFFFFFHWVESNGLATSICLCFSLITATKLVLVNCYYWCCWPAKFSSSFLNPTTWVNTSFSKLCSAVSTEYIYMVNRLATRSCYTSR